VDARELAVVEMMAGRPYTNDYTPNDPNPRPEAGNLLTSEFNKFLQYVGAQIEAQTLYADTGIFRGGFASGYSHVVFDWNAFEQYMIAAHDEPDVEKITDLVKLSAKLATYSPALRSQLESAFVDLIAERPGIATLLDVVTSIIGTSDVDVLYGTSGKDAINGQGGDDTLYGQAGNDVYIYRPGNGNDRIFDSAGSDQLYFMGGILPEHVTLTRDVSSIIVHITVGGATGEIRINNVFEGTAGALREGMIEQFRFESGAVWNQSQILAAIVQQATSGNDGLYGSSADETFSGLDGDDEIAGYGGGDVLNGDGGNDNLMGGTGNDVLNGGDGADILDGGADDDTLNGGTGNDSLIGGTGNDILIGGTGNDTLDGGVGSDTYVFNTGDGQDTINNYDAGTSRLDILSFGPDIDPADVTARRVDNNLVLTFADSDDKVAVTNYFVGDGAGAYRLDEIRFADATVWDVAAVKALVLVPTSGADILRGYETDDTLHGGDGNDTLYGNGGNDTLSGDAGNDTIYGGNGDDILFGGAGADILNGDAGHDQLDGGADDDTLRGGAGNDHLTGGLGNDQLEGGEGDDHYHFASGDGQDTINDTQGGLSTIHLSGLPLADVFLRRDGTALVLGFSGSPEDQIRLLNYFDPSTELALRALVIDTGSGAPWVLDAAAIDAQAMLGTAADDVIDGNTLDNVIEGLAGNDTLRGSAGADTLDGGAGNDALYGQTGDDLLLGGDGDDLLDGGTGADQLAGGSGGDTYVVDDVGDVVTEAAEAGNDLVRTSISYVLPENVERVELTGTADIDGTGNALDNTLTGNIGNNRLQGLSGDDVLFGNDGDDTLDGGIGDDQLYGGYGADVLIGGAGQDLLDGGGGLDQLAGAAGDDTYRVDESGDVIVEQAGEGVDVVESTAYSYALSAKVEHLTLVQDSGAYEGTGNALDNVLTGNGNDNRLDGGAGADTLIGGLGNDTYVVDNVGDVVVENAGEGTDTVESSISYMLGATLENLTLLGTANLDATGNTGDNVIRGNAGNNRIEGGAGADTLYGGAGDDDYVAVSASDRVYEYAGEGTDTVERVFETNLVLENNVENLILGAGTTTGNGNGLDNTITGSAGDNTLAGLDGDDTLHGLDGDDALFGGNGTDALYGGAGDDYLDGGAGVDYMEGGVGNDNYTVAHSDDVVIEAVGEGTDQVQASASYALSANIENLFLTGSAAIDGTGNDLDNYIAGNGAVNTIHGGAGADTIAGGVGNDTLVGGTGDDKYVFDASSGSDVVDNSDGGFDGVFFTNGITRERLSFGRDGDDLLIFVDAGAVPSVRVLNHFLGGNAAIDYVQPDGGFYLTTSEINQIVAGGSSGGEYDQVIEGTAAGEQLVGSSGEDLIKGLAGNDQLFGMGGNDTLQGGEGDDYLSGGNGSGSGSGDDRLEGGAGADTLVGEDGVNTLIGGAGNDNYIYGGGQDTINSTGGGTDGVFFNNGIAASDLAFYRDGDDLVITVAGNASGFVRVTGHFLGGDQALDFVQPASGNMLNTAAINALVQTGYPGSGEPGGGDPGTGNPGGGNEGNDSDYPNVVTGTANGEQLLGSSGRDLIRGLGGADELFGFGGDDKLDGGEGDDYVSGGNGSFSGSGNDILIGGAGNDTLVGEDGNDMLIGGAGDDFYYYASGSGSDTVDNTGGGTDWLYFADVSSTRLSFHQDGDDLIVRVDGDAGQQIRVLDHFLGGEHAISYVQPSNGNAIPASNIPALLTALPQGSSATAFQVVSRMAVPDATMLGERNPAGGARGPARGASIDDDVELPASFVGGAISRPDHVDSWRTNRLMDRHGGIARYWELDGPQFAIDDQLSVSHSAAALELDGLIHAMAGFQSQEAVIMAQHPYDFRQSPAFAVQV
jgi:Ca2+-binding RTX toxin-like protein